MADENANTAKAPVVVMDGATISPVIENVATKETELQRNATEGEEPVKRKWVRWVIGIAVLAAVVYGGWYLYKKYK